MTTNARKTDAQRLGNGKKAFNVKQVEKIVEEGSIEYTAGAGISISSENAISVDTATIQPKMSAGSGISISAQNEISVDTTTIQEKLTAGTGITIADNVISASGGSDGYTLYDSITWSNIIKKDDNNNWYVTKDCVIVLRDNHNFNYNITLHKGVLYGNSLTLNAVSYAQSGNTVNTAIIFFALYSVNFDATAIELTCQTLQVNASGATGFQSNATFTKDTSISGYIGNDHIRLFVKD